MQKKSFRMAAAAIATVALAGLGIAAPMAVADTGNPYVIGGVSQEAGNKALINPLGDVRLTIHKYLGATTGQVNNGTELTSVARPALAGVDFDVYRVDGVDLTTNAGWAAATALQGHMITAAEIAAGKITVGGTDYLLVKESTVTTNASGTATFNKVDGVGLYLVAENLASSGTITSGGTTVDKSTITPSSPFLVTLPMTNPNDLNRWMYDVHVYPKNQADSITKSVLDGNIGTANQDAYTVGQNLIYHLESSVQATDSNGDKVIDGKDLGYYYVGDNLSTYVDAKSVTVSVSGTGGSTLTGCDATVTPVPAGTNCDYYYWLDSDTATAGDQVKIVMSTSGLDKIVAAKVADPTAVVKTDIVATVVTVPASGEIPNKAEFIPSNGWYASNGGTPMTPPTPTTPPTDTPTTPGIPSNEVKTKYGDIKIVKKDANDTATMLAGAEFTVYRDTNLNGVCDAAELVDTNRVGNTVTTGADGSAVVKNLQLSNFYNNKDQSVLHSYCLVETKAPTGYNLNAEPILFSVTVAGAIQDPVLTTQLQTVLNEKSNLGNNLPLTGGAGVAAVSILGLLLVGGGLGYYVVSGRRREEQEMEA
jgi:LPXTG-motif cell wall-anchored protein